MGDHRDSDYPDSYALYLSHRELKKRGANMISRILSAAGISLVGSLLLLGLVDVHINMLSIAAEGQDLQKVTLKIEGMDCKSCVKVIRKALVKVPGVKSADVRITSSKEGTGQAVVECEKGNVTSDQLVKAVESASNAMFTYRASVITEE